VQCKDPRSDMGPPGAPCDYDINRLVFGSKDLSGLASQLFEVVQVIECVSKERDISSTREGLDCSLDCAFCFLL